MNKPLPNNSADIISQAIEKIKNETSDFKGESKEKVIHTYVSNTLIGFCEQDKRFAKVLLKTKRTLSDCCKYCLEGVTTAISDIDTYRRAVQFYFPNSEISMNMTITTGDIPDEEYINKEPEKRAEPKRAPKKSKPKNKEASSKKPISLSEPLHKPNPAKKAKKKDDGVIQLSLF